MVKVYRTVWNESLGAWVAVSELACSHGKSNRAGLVESAAPATSTRRHTYRRIVAAVAASLAWMPGMAMAYDISTNTTYDPSTNNSNMGVYGNGTVLNNKGTIAAISDLDFAALTLKGDNITVNNSGTIDGSLHTTDAVAIRGRNATINNTGVIKSDHGSIYNDGIEVRYTASGTININNAKGASISGDQAGIDYAPMIEIGAPPPDDLLIKIDNKGSISSNHSAIADFSKVWGNNYTSASWIVRNSGVIQGGVDSSDGIRGVAGVLGEKNDTLILEDGSDIRGVFDGAGGTNTLALGGASMNNPVFDISKIGPQYQHFQVLEKIESGNWTLSGANDGRQDWMVKGGTLTVGKDARLTGSITTASNDETTIVLDGGSVDAKGKVAIDMTNAGAATLVVNNTNGVSKVDGDIVIDGKKGPKTVRFDGSASSNTTLDKFKGATHYAKDGKGQWTLDGPSSQTGDWTINEGVLALNDGGALGKGAISANGGTILYGNGISVANSININDVLNLAVNGNDRAVQHGAISGASGTKLNKTGRGTLELNGDNSGFFGETNINDGTLEVNGRLGSRDVNVQSNATLSGNADIKGNVSVADNGHLAPGGNGALGTIHIGGNLRLEQNSELDMDIAAPGKSAKEPGASDAINVDGDLTLNGRLNINDLGGSGIGYYRLITYKGDLFDNGLDIGRLPKNFSRDDFALDLTNKGTIDLLVGLGGGGKGDGLQYWNGQTDKADGKKHGGDGVWSADGTNWTDINRRLSAKEDPAKVAIFDDKGGTVSVKGIHNLDGGIQILVDGYKFVRDPNGGSLVTNKPDSEVRVLDLATATISAPITGNGGIQKTGGGTLVLEGDNDYKGGTGLNGGTLKVSTDKNLGDASGGLRFNGGVLETTQDMTSGRDVSFGKNGGGLNVDDKTTLTLTGSLTGEGGMVKQGKGTLVLGNDHGGNSYRGGTDLNAGTIRVIGVSALGSGDIDANGGRLDFGDKARLDNNVHLNKDLVANVDGNEAVAYEMGNIGGTGKLTKTGDGKLVLAGNSSFSGGLDLNQGTIGLNSNHAAGRGTITGNGGGIDFDNGVYIGNTVDLKKTTEMNVSGIDSIAELGGSISGEGGIDKTGNGTLILGGKTMNYTGDTHVKEGTLRIDGDVEKTNVTVDHGATIGGKGKIGSLVAHGIIDPAGDGLGSLEIVHDALLGSDATYRLATIGPDGKSDLLHAGGKMTIDHSSLDIVAKSAEYQPRTTYKIASADAGLSGVFDKTSLNLPFLRSELSYDKNSVYMTLVRNDEMPFNLLPGLTDNQTGVAIAVDHMPENPLNKAIQSLTEDDARKAFNQLSGESYASLQNAVRDSTADFMSNVWSNLGGAGTLPCDGEKAPGKSLWIRTPASRSHVKGSNDLAGYDSSSYGVMAGIDSELATNLRAGVAAGFTHTDQNESAEVPSKGTLDNGMLAVYGQYDQDKLWFGGMAGVGYGRLSNTRDIDFPGYKATAKGSGSVQSLFARIGTGYRIPLSSSTMLEPMASLDVASARTADIVESDGRDANLHVKGSTITTVASEIGSKVTHRFDTQSGRPVMLDGSLAWRHLLNQPSTSQSASFIASSSPAYAYQGVAPVADSAVLGLGVRVGLSKTSDLSVSYQGRFGSGQTDNGIMGQYRLKF